MGQALARRARPKESLAHYRGARPFDRKPHHVVVNRTEALDMSRAAVREKKLVLPRRGPQVEEFAQHLTCDAKVLDEDDETGIKNYRYIRTGANHYSMALTYAWLASQTNTFWRSMQSYLRWCRENRGPWIA